MVNCYGIDGWLPLWRLPIRFGISDNSAELRLPLPRLPNDVGVGIQPPGADTDLAFKGRWRHSRMGERQFARLADDTPIVR